jgi:hypothetical protein
VHRLFTQGEREETSDDAAIELDTDGDIVQDYTAISSLPKRRVKKAKVAEEAITPEDEDNENAVIYAYYTKSDNKKGLKRWLCSGCPSKRRAVGHAAGCTSNLIKHQLICPGFPEAMALNAPGVVQSNVEIWDRKHGTNTQSTLLPESGELKVPFTDAGYRPDSFVG